MSLVDPQPLLVVTGPTASGKTALAIALAKSFEGELIGADSVQVYRGFDIGSGKPTPQELQGIPHHLIDIREPDAWIDAARYAELADQAIAEVRARGHTPIVVGGAGLWLRALLRGLVEAPQAPEELRAQLRDEAQRDGAAAMHERLRGLDPESAAELHPNDLVRVLRALEIHAVTGVAAGTLRAGHQLGAPRYQALRIALEHRTDLLHARITQRTAEMVARGLEREARGLLAKHGADVRAFGSVGYKQLLVHIQGQSSLPAAIRDIDRATRIYARRQRTWLRSEPGERWDTPPVNVTTAQGLGRLEAFLKGNVA